MTKEEAIENLKILKEDYWDDDGYGHESKLYDDTVVALDMGIKALQEQKHAHWKKSKTTEGIIYCSLCHYNQYVYKTPFCALCGARMDEKEGAEE